MSEEAEQKSAEEEKKEETEEEKKGEDEQETNEEETKKEEENNQEDKSETKGTEQGFTKTDEDLLQDIQVRFDTDIMLKFCFASIEL